MRHSFAVALALGAAAAFGVPAGVPGAAACQGRCAAPGEEEPDEVAALHLQRRRPVVAREHESKPRWRDAGEVVREHLAALQAGHQLHQAHSRPLLAPNVQAPPQPPPYGPFKRTNGLNFPRGPPPPSEELVQPASVKSENGLLDITLVVDWGWVEFPGLGIRFRTRLYNNSYPGPTIRFSRGDHLRIKVVNKLGEDIPDSVAFQRREGQGTESAENGVEVTNPRYQNVGQVPGYPAMMKGSTNNFHHPNSTNLHVHGLHVANFQPQDEVFITSIPPGGEWTYELDVSPYHSCGTSWYHPHLHGASVLQVHGGMAGALIIEDYGTETLPEALGVREVVCVIQSVSASYFGPEYLKFFPDDPSQGCWEYGSTFSNKCNLGHRTGILANYSGDRLWKVEYMQGFGYQVNQTRPTTNFYVVNGQYRPTFHMKTGEFVRFRLILATGEDGVNLFINDTNTNACETYLLGKDNVPLEVMPRKITKGVFLSSGNRAQVLVRCSKAGVYSLQNTAPFYFMTDFAPFQEFMLLNVTGPDTFGEPPQPWRPDRPRYLNDLVKVPYADLATPVVPPATNYDNGLPLETNYPLLQKKTIMQETVGDVLDSQSAPATENIDSSVRFTINNMTFHHDHPAAIIGIGQVVEVDIKGLDFHSWHMHTHPVQYQSFGVPDYKERWGGYFEVGDWTDTVAFPDFSPTANKVTPSAVVRFQTDCYGGILTIHCHVLYHEDMGMMTFFNVTGEEYTVNPKFENQGVFKDPPKQCMKAGQQCAPPHCTNYNYAPGGSR